MTEAASARASAPPPPPPPTPPPQPSVALVQPDSKFTVENVEFLMAMLEQLQVDTENPQPLVDAMRELVEVVVWGDKFNESIIDLFMERNMIGFFSAAVNNETANVTVKTQCFQCVTILLGNLSQQSSIYFVMSNNHINRIISSTALDFDNDEIVSNYISFTKALSLKLDSDLVQFFFDQQNQRFPLYEHSVRLLDHNDRLVRTSVRQVVANVLAIKDAGVQRYVRKNLPEFILASSKHIIKNIATLASTLTAEALSAKSAAPTPIMSIAAVDGIIEDVSDELYYFSDLHNVCPPDLQTAVFETLATNLARPLCAAAADDPHPAWVMVLSNWVRINAIERLTVESLLLAPAAAATGILASPGKASHHPCAIALLSNTVAAWGKLSPESKARVREVARERGDSFITSSSVDSVLLGVRSLLWRPRERSPLVLALALDTAVRLFRLANEFAEASELDADVHKAQWEREGEPALRRTLSATTWWYQQHILSDMETPASDATPPVGTSPESKALQVVADHAPSSSSESALAATVAPTMAALQTPPADRTKASAFSVDDEHGSGGSYAMLSPRRRPRAVTEYEASPATVSAEAFAEMAAERRVFEVNLGVLFEALCTLNAAPLQSWLGDLKANIGRAGRDVVFLRWSTTPVLTGDAKRKVTVVCLALVRSTILAAAPGPFRKNAGAVWGIDPALAEVVRAAANGADYAPKLRPCDCVPAQVCAVDDVDASVRLIEKSESVVKGIPLGAPLMLSLVGGQLVLVDFRSAASGAVQDHATSTSVVPEVVLVLALAFTCAIVESQRPFRLRCQVECSNPALTPVRELGIVLRDRTLCRAVVSRMNSASMAVRQLCREELRTFLNAPMMN
jgi:hypothetical protein